MSHTNGSSKAQAKLKNPHLLKRQGKRSYVEDQEIKALEERLVSGAPARGTNPLLQSIGAEPQQRPAAPGSGGGSGADAAGASTSYAGARTFDELPLSQYTKDGLRKANYLTLTAVQRAALPHALAGRDVLGAAKTGSGKTLAFLLPVSSRGIHLAWRGAAG